MKFLFDLGGVFFDWNPKYFFKDIFRSNEELDFFLNNVCNNEWNIKQDAGRSFQEAVNELIPKFPKYEKQIKMYYNNHRSMIKGTFKESIAVLNLNPRKIFFYPKNLFVLHQTKNYENDKL